MSIFDDDVCLHEERVIRHIISTKKVQPKVIAPADSPHIIYFRNKSAKPPDWVEFWQVADPIRVQTADAVAFLQADGRTFAVCHGHSSHLLNPYSVEYDFGLRTALNLLDKKSIRSADMLSPSELSIRTRKQSSVDSDFDNYEVNVLNTILSNITGKVQPKYKTLFEAVNGADCIRFSHKGTPKELEDILRDLLVHYKSDSYKDSGFGFIDNFSPIKDPILLDTFESQLISAVNSRASGLTLNVPSGLDREGIFNFRFRSLGEAKRKVFDNLDIDSSLYKILNETHKQFANKEDFRTARLEVLEQNNQDIVLENYPLCHCLHWELTHDGKMYFLESGIWYLVNVDYLNIINSSLEDLLSKADRAKFAFDKTALKEKYDHAGGVRRYEYWYNLELVKYYSTNEVEAILMDQNLVQLTGQSAVELCDVLSKEADGYHLLHVKYKHGSTSLSHLFGQGNVSAELLYDERFRVAANEVIEDGNLKLPTNANHNPLDYTIIYGIICRMSEGEPASIPLFSKITLKVFFDSLSRMQYRVRLMFIEEK
jgi:uncharacterized protein (TIGR04141 family)